MFSSLKINYEKCEFVGIMVTPNLLNYMADAFGYKVGKLLAKYLSLPLCTRILKQHLWEPVVERIERKLSSWKGRYLSLERRSILIKSVLSSIPMYFLFCIRCPKTVV